VRSPPNITPPIMKMPISGKASVPIGSACAIGLSVTRPWWRGMRSPSRSATQACPNSWNPIDTISASMKTTA
jgi:hypothetical protein